MKLGTYIYAFNNANYALNFGKYFQNPNKNLNKAYKDTDILTQFNYSHIITSYNKVKQFCKEIILLFKNYRQIDLKWLLNPTIQFCNYLIFVGRGGVGSDFWGPTLKKTSNLGKSLSSAVNGLTCNYPFKSVVKRLWGFKTPLATK